MTHAAVSDQLAGPAQPLQRWSSARAREIQEGGVRKPLRPGKAGHLGSDFTAESLQSLANDVSGRGDGWPMRGWETANFRHRVNGHTHDPHHDPV